MARVIIFGGTAEGRELAEYAASEGIRTLLSVVSAYGKRVVEERENLSVRWGALDEEGIFRLLEEEKPQLILDATHPHAAAATAQIQAACGRAGLRCLRVLREPGQETDEEFDEPAELFRVENSREAVEILRTDQEPVLLTTGSKELPLFAADPLLRERIFARVLPDSEILARCQQLGLAGRQLIAMQGPFSEEMNVAMLHATGAGWLVTKESGGRGGYREKLRAAKSCNVRTIVIQRPGQETGISPAQAREELRRQTGVSERELFLIGMGMGSGSQLTLEAWEALKRCEAVLGAPRMLKDIEKWTEGKIRENVYLGEKVLDWIGRHPEVKQIAVVYSGDTGFYSGCSSLLEILAGWQEEISKKERLRIRIFPGISALSCLCARLGCSWENIYPASAHGRECDIEKLLLQHSRIFLLLGGKEGLGSLCRRLEQAGLGDVQVRAGIRLGYPEEKILTGRARELGASQEDSLAAVILEG